MPTTVLLVHGGLWEDMTAERFWRRPGIVSGLERRGFHVIAPDRLRRADSWDAEATYLGSFLPSSPVTVVAASAGCSAAVRLALSRPDAVARLLFGWPASFRDTDLASNLSEYLGRLGATPSVVSALPGCPGTVRPEFPPHLEALLDTITGFATG
jgi:pimeloyl-ACP methyl ester carboxylesterase